MSRHPVAVFFLGLYPRRNCGHLSFRTILEKRGPAPGRHEGRRIQPVIRSWCTDAGVEFEVIHTSGHADAHDLQRLIEGIKPRRVVPIHTLAADRYPNANSEILRLADGEWLTL